MFSPEERLKYIFTFMKFQENDLELDFWQNDFVRSTSRFIIINKSRRTGYSLATAAKGLVKAMDPDRVAYTQQFVSYNEDDALEKMRYAQQFYDSIPVNCRKKLKKCNESMMEFYDSNGKTTSRLISMPCRPVRGKGGSVALDEFAIYQPRMADIIYTSAIGVISRGGCLEMGSTPLGKIGKFYEILSDRNKYKTYERYNVPWWYSSGLCKDVKAALKNAAGMTTEERVMKYGKDSLVYLYQSSDIDSFQQEFECEFLDSESSFITLDLIYANTPGMRDGDIILPDSEKMDDEEYWQYNRNIDFQAYKDPDSAISQYNPEKHGSPLYFGYDVGRTHDATDIYLIGVMPDGKKRSFARIEMKNKPYREQEETILKLYQGLPIHRGCMDSTGMGKPIFEDLQRRLGERLEGITFTPEIKEVMAIEVKRGLEQKEFLLENNKEFHNQIHSIKRTSTGGKYFRYDAARNEKGHADAFWAWALSNMAITTLKQGNFYTLRKAQNEVNLNVKTTVTESSNNNKAADSLTNRKGKSLTSLQRGFANAYRHKK